MERDTDTQRANDLAELLATPDIRRQMARIVAELQELEADVLRVTRNAGTVLAQIDVVGRLLYDGDVQRLTPPYGLEEFAFGRFIEASGAGEVTLWLHRLAGPLAELA